MAAAAAVAADLTPASPALCRPDQKVMFHCTVGARSASLCADTDGSRITALAYRYGRPGRVELSWAAASDGDQRFRATVAPAAPGAAVRQVWFTRAGYTYLLSQCVGGSCPSDAGIAVLRGDALLSRQRCLRSADDRAWFAPELVQFGRTPEATRSMTDRLVVDDVDNGVERLYPVRSAR